MVDYRSIKSNSLKLTVIVHNSDCLRRIQNRHTIKRRADVNVETLFLFLQTDVIKDGYVQTLFSYI